MAHEIQLITYLLYKSLPEDKKKFAKMYLLRFIPIVLVWLFLCGTLIEVYDGKTYLEGFLLVMICLIPLPFIAFLLNKNFLPNTPNKEIKRIIMQIIGFTYVIIPAIAIISTSKMYKFVSPYEKGCAETSMGILMFYLIFVIGKISNQVVRTKKGE
jgi:hypothetical protein